MNVNASATNKSDFILKFYKAIEIGFGLEKKGFILIKFYYNFESRRNRLTHTKVLFHSVNILLELS